MTFYLYRMQFACKLQRNLVTKYGACIELITKFLCIFLKNVNNNFILIFLNVIDAHNLIKDVRNTTKKNLVESACPTHQSRRIF